MIHVEDLPESAQDTFLYCQVCESEWSATRGDYFLLRPDHVLTCCEVPMILARSETTIIEVAP